jgi:hypothetical protein
MFEITNEEGKFKLTNTFGTWIVYAPNNKKLEFPTKREAIAAINFRFHLHV